MNTNLLNQISPIDGRYFNKAGKSLSPFFSEGALIKYRLIVEIKWLIHITKKLSLENQDSHIDFLESITTNFDYNEAHKIKSIEKETAHDVKAVEYYIREKLQTRKELQKLIPFIHFACTSEDINNLSYALSIKESLNNVILPEINIVINAIKQMAFDYSSTPIFLKTVESLKSL